MSKEGEIRCLFSERHQPKLTKRQSFSNIDPLETTSPACSLFAALQPFFYGLHTKLSYTIRQAA
jgi:hypothetical protein